LIEAGSLRRTGELEALLERGAELTDTADVLALALSADLAAPGVPGLDVRWRLTPEISRDANAVGIAVFGGKGGRR
jgi:hypothetical protein